MKIVRTLLLLCLLAAALLAYWIVVPSGPSRETFVDLPSGTGTQAIASALQQAGIIRSRFAFDLLRLIRGGTLRAGEYRFDHPASAIDVYRRLARSDVYTRSVTIPEGSNLFDIATAIQNAGLGTREHFLDAAHCNTALIAEWSPNAQSLEGYLFPDTYRFSRHATEVQILAAMVKRFRQVAGSAGLLRNSSAIARTVTTASLVEKEVSADAERPLVAGVFLNRLQLGMPLQTDPSVVYAAMLDGRWRGTIYQSDLQSPSPYNTYKHIGLPPGPICSPGLAALKAAAAPASTKYLYFVADAAGHSRFAATLAEHQGNVVRYRAANR